MIDIKKIKKRISERTAKNGIKKTQFPRTSIIQNNFTWKSVVFFLLFLPFQRTLWVVLKLPDYFNWTDEIFVITIFVSGLIFLYQLNKSQIRILFILAVFVMFGCISGFINKNGSFATIFGIFDYLKNFLIIPFIGLLFYKSQRTQYLYKALHTLALVFCLVAIFQEIGFLLGIPPDKLTVGYITFIRYHLLRVPSLMGHPNIFGFYILMFFILDVNIHRRIRWQNVLMTIGIMLCISRMVWAAYICFLIIFFIRNNIRLNKRKAFFTTITVLFLISLYLFTICCSTKNVGFRRYSFGKSVEIFKDYPVFGVGPGRYGGLASLLFKSNVYEKYNFSAFRKHELERYRSLDQFWIQLLAETGIAGMAVFIILIILLSYIPYKRSLSSGGDSFIVGYFKGLSYMWIPFLVYSLGTGLNHASFLLTYTVLVGISLRVSNPQPDTK